MKAAPSDVTRAAAGPNAKPGSVPLTKRARHATIIALLERRPVRSQTELAELLADQGLAVTQGTLSRDLVEIGALRVRGGDGHLVYAVPGEGGDRRPVLAESAAFESRLTRLCSEVLVSAESSANLVVLRTPPGAAQYFASAIDRVGWSSILGTIAGDDTILLITRDPDGGSRVAADFLAMTAQHDTAYPGDTQLVTTQAQTARSESARSEVDIAELPGRPA